jgi:hypothetical protein
MDTSIIILGVIAIIAIIYFIYSQSQNTKNKNTERQLIDTYSENGKQWVNYMCSLFDTGQTYPFPDSTADLRNSVEELYEKKFNISLEPNQHGIKYTAMQRDMGLNLDSSWRDLTVTSEEYRKNAFAEDLSMALANRFSYEYLPISYENETDTLKKYGLNIDSDEKLYYRSIKIDWYEEKVIGGNIQYNGFRVKSGRSIGFNTGNVTYFKQDITSFVLLDRGDLYITDKRVIFIGNQSRQNRTIKINDILELTMYFDGVLLGKSNGKQPLIFVPNYSSSLIPRDNLACIVRVLNRLLSGNQDEDLRTK